MAELSEKEVSVFLLCIVSGIFFGILFDIFKIIRQSFSDKAYIIDWCDGLFWTAYACFFIWWMFRINDGELRWFVFAGMMLGATLHFLLFSRLIVCGGVFIVNILKKIFYVLLTVLLFPLRFTVKKARIAAVAVVAPFKILNKKRSAVKRIVVTKLKIRNFCKKKI